MFGLRCQRHVARSLAVVVITLQLVICHMKCLVERPDIHPKRHFYYKGSSLPIRIDASDRVSHQLVSHILKILLIEELGYSNVQIKRSSSSLNATVTLERLSSSAHADIPQAMVNMEVWVPPGFNLETWTNDGQLISGGPLGPYGRFGWFVLTTFVEETWNRSQVMIDHWKSLTVKETAKIFSVESQRELLKNVLTRPDLTSKATYCDQMEADCSEGILVQNARCHHQLSRERCALLLSSFPELDGGILKRQIQNLDICSDISWIGKHLNSFVRQRSVNKSPTLFFNWVPNDLTASGNYSRIHFPVCHSSDRSPFDCDFQIHQLTKVMWGVMRSHIPEAYRLISNIEFSQDEIEDLLMGFTTLNDASETLGADEVLEQTACNWLRNNRNLWLKWIPENVSSKMPIYLGGMFPLTGPYWRQPAILEGAKMAIDFINDDDNILPDYQLVLLVQDTQCKVDMAMKHFVQYISNVTHPIAGIVGPGCSETAEPIAGVSKHFNTIVISYSAEALQLTNRAMFPLFFRTVPHILQNGDVYIELFKRWRWEQVALLAEDGQNFPEYHAFLKDLFLGHSVQVAFDRKMPRQASPDDAAKYMDELKRIDVKIIIMTSFEQSARAVICDAYKKGMTASEGYVWFLPAWFTQNWWLTERYNEFFSEGVPCTSAEMERAVQGHFFLNTAFLGHEDAVIVGDMTVREWANIYFDKIEEMEIEVSPYGSYAYDAVLVFALGLDKLLSEDPSALESLHTDKTVERFMYYLNNTHFSGASGPVQFSGADRTGIININQHVGNASSFVGQFYPDRNVSHRLNLNDSFIVWITGSVPSDGSPLPKVCSLEKFRLLLGVDCDTAIVVANAIGIALFLVLTVIGLVVVKRKYDLKVRATRERMEELGLLEQNTSWLCLDQWEVSRDHVVLNRKLGEGAFGTVYGGEALIEDVWVAVAVKTLKIGSNPEEKLDFLSEAEMMKRFEHDNIVKLLGVCTRGEPAFTIMEFMLHGDLKTFLLSRRQLVGQMSKEADDVSSKGLTQMALDVAHGLKYLADLNYVHRDLACRNCLVHAGKTVKIGDFGMTRPMYDSDYYRFNKRGMFPVRWMAPESLSDGLFGTTSDIWSYGVLLYEIMTFGSFPYQGLSNRQVLNFVKNGEIISLPRGCPPKVQTLLRSCWLFDAKARPTVDYIIEVLEQSPLLLVPCLDTPCTSVALEGPGSLEMNLLPRVRHRNPYQKTPGGDRPPRRGLSLSSPENESKVSVDRSPCVNLLMESYEMKNRTVSSDSDEPSKTDANAATTTANGQTVRLPGNLVARISLLSRSLSADDTLNSFSKKTNSEQRLNVNFKHDKRTLAPLLIDNEQDRFATEPRHGATKKLNDIPLSLDSRADSDYCSQHSKDFSNLGCVPFV